MVESKNKRVLSSDDESSIVSPVKVPHLMASKRLPRSFYDKSSLTLSRQLLGKRLVRRLDSSTILSGIIVETEAYDGAADPACHSFRGKTKRNGSMFKQPGTLYVYSIYGCYFCSNISSAGEGCAVLLRALKPEKGMDSMRVARKNRKTAKEPSKNRDLCNGPSKLCQALTIEKSLDGLDLCDAKADLWLEDTDSVTDGDIVQCTRIGIEGSGPEAVALPYRFYIRTEECVSKRDRKMEVICRNDT